LGADGAPVNVAGFPPAAGNGLGSVNGLGFGIDRLTVVQGRMADPRRANEVVMQKDVAQMAGFHVGERIPLGIYTNAQTLLPAFGTAGVAPYRRVVVTLVGTVVQARSVVEDDVDNSASLAFFTPAFTDPLLTCCANYTGTAIQVRQGGGRLEAVERGVARVLPRGFPAPIVQSTATDKAERAIKPESIALGVFGGIAALAAILIAAQVIGRQTRRASEELGTLRALGAAPAATVLDGLVGMMAAVVAGAFLAAGVAVALSPLEPLGPVRPFDPAGGVSFDWMVLGLGFGVLVVTLGSVAAVLAYRGAPHRVAQRRQGAWTPSSSVARLAANSGMPAPAVAGVRFALEPGAGGNTVPVRSAILGAVLAVVVMVGTVTFGASLSSLVSHPALYGWNWDYILAAGGGSGDIPQQPATRLLDHDPFVRSWSAAYTDDLIIDGQVVPVIGEIPGAVVQPPILSGHGLRAADEIVLGAITLSELHRHLGDAVTVVSGLGPPAHLRVVGTATLPTLGLAGGPHLDMGTGAVLPYADIPVAARNPFNDPVTGPENILVRIRPGADHRAALHSLQQMSGPLSNNFNFGVAVMAVLRPAEIVNYRSMGTTPAVLGGALAAGAVVALSLTLAASVRRRRRALAMLKTLGFTGRQLASVVAWQSSVAVAIGTVVGVPLGIVAGRVLWTLFAQEIHAVPSPSVPVLTIALIAVGALVVANIVAAVPGRIAARTSTALLLRAE
jgi:hypothetical protein